MNREDFPMLKQNIIYFDNGATTFKPNSVIKATVDYYENYTANAHRGDYDISLKVDNTYEETRDLVKEFIGAKKREEIVFTSGTTESLNIIVNGYFKNNLKPGDEVLITKSEHAANVLPWFELADQIDLKINYINLNEDLKVTLDNVKKSLTENTKVISLAHVTNVAGDIRPLKEIIELAHQHNILVVVDGAQSIPHFKVNVEDLDIDFLAFSAHKMLGPTGVGVLYGKYELLDKTLPSKTGGGMNVSFAYDTNREYMKLPTRLEAGTPNIAGIIGFGATIKYLNNLDLNKIHQHEAELKQYALTKLKEIPEIKVYNPNTEAGIIAFNYDGVFAQDLAIYLNKYNICVRAGNHCAKILKDELGITNTCRASFYLYNTKEEIDKFIEALKNPNLKEDII